MNAKETACYLRQFNMRPKKINKRIMKFRKIRGVYCSKDMSSQMKKNVFEVFERCWSLQPERAKCNFKWKQL